jgi:uncharacterized Rossmann fold enzyme
MGSIAVVTSFSPDGYELYGRRMVETFEKYWPADVKLYVYYEGEKPEAASDRAEWVSLDKDEDRAAFMAANKDHPTDYNLQPVKFSHKVFAVTSAPRDTDWLIWLDGDVETIAPVTHEFLKSMYPDDIVAAYMGRQWWNHTECGFVAYRLDDDGKRFLDDFRLMYTTGEIMEIGPYRGRLQRHDCVAFDLLREAYEQEGHSFHDLGEVHKGPDLDVMSFTPLARVMYHYKGKRKTQAGNYAPSRYDQLIKLVDLCRPKTIVEVGVHKGKRAERMCLEALKHNAFVHYTGYDLFDEASQETDAAEKNGKGAPDLVEAQQKLDRLKMDYPGFTWDFVKGDTRQTLHGKSITVDFAFIDGGHSVETIRGDYEALKSSRLIAFDDYYTKGVDTKQFGCNEVIRGRTYTVLPWEDWVRGDGRTRLAVVGDYPHKKYVKPDQTKRRKLTAEWEALFDEQRKLLAKYGDPTTSAQTFAMWENDKEDKPADILFAVNILEHLMDYEAALANIRTLARKGVLFVIKPDLMADAAMWKHFIGRHFRVTDTLERDGNLVISADCNVLVPGVKPIPSSTDEKRWQQIKASCAKYKTYVDLKPKHERRAIIACYGPSLKDYIEKLKEEAQDPNTDVVSVSGSHDYLIEHGIIPRYHVECDPRPHKAVQVTPRDGVSYLLAASCHGDLFDKMEGMDVRLWHAEEHIRVRDELKNDAPNISGGGSVGLRAISVMYFMGYRNLTIYGMDCSFEDEGKTQHAGKHAGKIQTTCLTKIEDRHFVTSPILMTYAANFFDMVKQRPDVKWRLYGDGLLQNWVRYATKLAQEAA